MRRLLLTHSDDTDLLALVSPVFGHYAERHGYTLRVVSASRDIGSRSSHWTKIHLLQEALVDFDVVVWCDADVLLRGPGDVANGLQPGDVHGLVMEQTPHGIGPNTGVWVLRPDAIALLDQIWRVGQLPDATLHDQATVAHVLGFSYLPAYTRPVAPSPWLARTSWLDWRWNVLRVHNPESIQASHGLHYGGMGPERNALVRQQIIDDRLAGWERLLSPNVVATVTQWQPHVD